MADTAAPAPDTAPRACLNCGQPLGEPVLRFCGHCGQETHIRPPTVGEFLQQFGGAYFSTEGALWRTLALLLLKPGELTRRYFAGQRKHYVLPLRLYLTISVLTLLLLRAVVPVSLTVNADANLDPANFSGTLLDMGNGSRVGVEKGRFFCEQLPQALCSRLGERLDTDAKGFARELRHAPERFISQWGTAMFLMVPLYAAFTALVYWGRGRRYTEHLVYALHVHSFWFVALALAMLPWAPLAAALAMAVPAYTLVAARRTYGGTWWGTAWRAGLVALCYGITLSFTLVAVVMTTFLT